VRGEKGFALVLVLVVTALMVAVTAELIHQVYVDISLSRGFRDGQQASLLAESGITAGAKYLKFFFSDEYTTLFDPLKQEDETGTIEISATEESGKINLNLLVLPNGDMEQITYKALLRLGKRLKIPDDVWSSLADWLDSNDEQRSGGAETPYYQTLKPPYRARNGRLATVAELSLIKGFTPEIIARLKPSRPAAWQHNSRSTSIPRLWK
jgi:general secretion pathway protein K